MWKIYDRPFQELLDGVGEPGKETPEWADAVGFYPPYSTHQIAEPANSVYDWLRLKHMSVFVNVLSVVMGLRTQGYIFGSVFLFKTRYELLKGEKEDVVYPIEKEDFLWLDDRSTQKTTMFDVNSKELDYVRAPGMYHSDPRVKHLYHRY